MSEENKNTETEVKTETKKSGLFGWVKNFVSAVVGAAISFGVTLGVVSADQEKELNARLNNINVKAEEVVTALQNKDVNTAIVKAQEIASETKVAVETAKEVVDALTAAGEKVGLVKVHLYRPFYFSFLATYSMASS